MISALLSAIVISSATPKPVVAIIPRPVQLTLHSGFFTVNSKTDLSVGRGCEEVANRLRGYLSPGTGYEFLDGTVRKGETISFRIDPRQEHGKEGYVLDVTPNKISIVGGGAAGVFYGVQTLRQLFPSQTFRSVNLDKGPYKIHCLHIVDYPRFSWRGCHLDCGRHFMPKSFILRFLDWMALHKLNTFHWHLTEDQGWRLQIPQYPKLTSVGAWRDRSMTVYSPPQFDNRAYGGFYTVEDAKEVVAYAKQRFINVVPEIEMPGHSQAAVASYPQLGNTGKQVPVLDSYGVSADVLNMKSSTIKFLQNVLLEVMRIFPSKFIHLGGDEAPTTFWKNSPAMQAKMKRLGIKHARGLQSWFSHQMASFLAAHGRRMIGWDEILEGGPLAPGTTVMSWRGEQGGIDAAKDGHDVVMAPGQYTYLDHYQSRDIDLEPHAIGGLLTLHQIYDYEPVPAGMPAADAKHVLGAQTQLWTEYMPDQLHVEYMAYPRLCAFSEVVWSPKKGKNYADFMARLKVHLHRLRAMGINYRRLNPPEPILAKDIVDIQHLQVRQINSSLASQATETMIPGDTSTNPRDACKIGIGNLIHSNQIVRIGFWTNDGSTVTNVFRAVVVVGTKVYQMTPSAVDPNAYSVKIGKLPPQKSAGDAQLIVVFQPTPSHPVPEEIQLLPDPTVYHPYFEGAR